jgi:hypothetical protein
MQNDVPRSHATPTSLKNETQSFVLRASGLNSRIPRSDSIFCIKSMIKKTGDWKKHVEANSRLMKKFEESRAELEKVLRVAQEGLEEKGDPEELLRRHTVSLLHMVQLIHVCGQPISGK